MNGDAFETFWRAYPRRIGKGAARKAFDKAIHLADLPTMLRAIEAYKRFKPSWQDFCHPSTWLNGERWSDEWDQPSKPRNYADFARGIFDGSASDAASQCHDERLQIVGRRH